MSVAKLLFSGLLVASGLILGAFTLHASLAPERQALAPGSRSSGKPQPVDFSQEPGRPAAKDVPDNWTPRLTKANPRPEAKPPAAAAEAAKAKRKTAADKGQKVEQAKQEEQTVLSWLTGLLSN